jgi:hypothetical protein
VDFAVVLISVRKKPIRKVIVLKVVLYVRLKPMKMEIAGSCADIVERRIY